MDKPYEQPTTSEISTSILNFQGPVLSMRAFMQTGPRKHRNVALEEFKQGCKEINAHFGKTLDIRVPRSTKKQIIFIKKDPDAIDWKNIDPSLITKEQYTSKLKMQCHSSVGNGIKEFLIKEGHVTERLFQ